MATNNREQLLQKAIKFAAEDGPELRYTTLEVEKNTMALNRGYSRGGSRKNEKPNFIT